MLEAVVCGTRDPELESVEVTVTVSAITTGMGWTEVSKPVIVTGEVSRDTERECYDLGATVAANLLG